MANNFGLSGGIGDVSGSLRGGEMQVSASQQIKPVTPVEGELHELNKATGELLARLGQLVNRIQAVSHPSAEGQSNSAERTGSAERVGPSSPIAIAIRGQREMLNSAIQQINFAIAHLEI